MLCVVHFYPTCREGIGETEVVGQTNKPKLQIESKYGTVHVGGGMEWKEVDKQE